MGQVASEYKKVCIVEDKTDLREGMSMMIEMSEHYLLSGSFANAEEALKKIPEIQPDAVLMDINLPGQSGIACVSALKLMIPEIQFLMCTAYEDNEKIFNSLKAGASGYILKTEGTEKIMEALDEMLAGGSPMSSSIARKVVASFSPSQNNNPIMEELTSRETEVLQSLAKGLIGKEVADALDISTGTVRKHVQNIYKKLQVNTRVEAVNLFLNR
ncbi:MAG: response regulator transcription factor [Niastella sp.]|nr:response regulator transcription factor [Niastella sp.]